ncbi:hypothetical protein J4730_22175 [Klebsiella pneumoniae]|uniref:Uncharacterized protein n=1 Tax=Klebsiella pneumoniae TaxID=573 RepID=A0A939SU81_KLEPN|nr:hypothetical protein [Klebsiella pneumoniae]
MAYYADIPAGAGPRYWIGDEYGWRGTGLIYYGTQNFEIGGFKLQNVKTGERISGMVLKMAISMILTCGNRTKTATGSISPTVPAICGYDKFSAMHVMTVWQW